MMKSLYKIATTVFMTVSAFVVADCRTTFEAGVGYRRDDINWNRSSRGDCSSEASDIIVDGERSRIKLEDMDIFLLNAKARSQDDCYYFRISGDYGWITDGKVRRSESFGPLSVDNNRFSHKVDGNYVADVSVAIGYPFIMGCCNEFTIAPIIGYSWHTQHIDTKRRNDSCSDAIDPILFCSGKDKFRFSWYAPYVGVDLLYTLDETWGLYGEFEYHFCGQGKRKHSDSCFLGSEEFSRNNKSKNAQGFVGEIGATYNFACDWYAVLAVDLKYWTSKAGSHSRGHLKWTSWGINANVGYVF